MTKNKIDFEHFLLKTDGKLYCVRYGEEGLVPKAGDPNPYSLSTLPFIFDEGTKVKHLLQLVESSEMLKSICFHADAFLAESKLKAENVLSGKLHFYWHEVEKDCEITTHNFMDVVHLDDETRYSISMVPMNELMELELSVDSTFKVVDEKYNEVFSMSTLPTLYSIIHGLFWETSFFGDPHDRDKEHAELLETVENLKAGTLETVSIDELFENIKKEENDE